MDLKENLKAEAVRLGFIDCRVAAAVSLPHYSHYLRWVEQGRQADMAYMSTAEAIESREHPEKLLPGCKSVICVALAYAPNTPKREGSERPSGRIAAYARYPDYHAVLKERLGKLAERLLSLAPESKVRLCVDTSPLLEKGYAQAAGLGWIGRNSLLNHPQHGSWLLLGEILTDLKLEPDLPVEENSCADCLRCQMACPTKALRPGRSVDARRCLSYLSIEHRGSIPVEFRDLMGTRLFGCDTCQVICPQHSGNQKPDADFKPVLAADQDLIGILEMDAIAFKAAFGGTPLMRAKLQGLRRNAAICLGNSNETWLLPLLQRLLREEEDPVVAESLHWAIEKLQQQP